MGRTCNGQWICLLHTTVVAVVLLLPRADEAFVRADEAFVRADEAFVTAGYRWDTDGIQMGSRIRWVVWLHRCDLDTGRSPHHHDGSGVARAYYCGAVRGICVCGVSGMQRSRRRREGNRKLSSPLLSSSTRCYCGTIRTE